MITVTSQAMDVIQDWISARDTPAQGGLYIRIPSIPRTDLDRMEGVDLEVVHGVPAKTVQLLAGQDCRIFLDFDVLPYLRDKVLHATRGADGVPRFVVTRSAVPRPAEVAVLAE